MDNILRRTACRQCKAFLGTSLSHRTHSGNLVRRRMFVTDSHISFRIATTRYNTSLSGFLIPSNQRGFAQVLYRPTEAHGDAGPPPIPPSLVANEPPSSSSEDHAEAQESPSIEPIVPLESESQAEEDLRISITPAAEQRIKAIQQRDKNQNLALRVAVEAGGCHGYQYKLELTDSANRDPSDDYVFSTESSEDPAVVVDSMSLSLLNGATVDFATELIGSSFRISDNPQAKGSGCGCGVSWDLKE